MTSRLIDPTFRAVDSTGTPINGAKLYIYEAGTTTPINTYSDSALTTPNTNPVISNSVGFFSDMFVAADDYKVVYKDANDNTLRTWDDINISATSSLSGGINADGYTEHLTNAQTGTTYTLLTGDRAKRVTFSNSSAVAITLPQANGTTFPDGWYVICINKGAGLVTITPTTSTIGGLTAITLTRGQSATVYSDGTNYDYEIKGEEVGNVKYGYKSSAPTGYLVENGTQTLGSASSGATFAHARYEALYHYYWNAVSDAYCPVSTGRGASAAADFAANKTLTMPNNANHSPYGVGTAATGETAGAATVQSTGTIGTSGATTLTTSQIPTPTFTILSRGNVNDSATSDVASADSSGAGGNISSSAITTNYGGGSHTHTGGTFTGDATSVLHPVRGIYWYIKY